VQYRAIAARRVRGLGSTKADSTTSGGGGGSGSKGGVEGGLLELVALFRSEVSFLCRSDRTTLPNIMESDWMFDARWRDISSRTVLDSKSATVRSRSITNLASILIRGVIVTGVTSLLFVRLAGSLQSQRGNRLLLFVRTPQFGQLLL